MDHITYCMLHGNRKGFNMFNSFTSVLQPCDWLSTIMFTNSLATAAGWSPCQHNSSQILRAGFSSGRWWDGGYIRSGIGTSLVFTHLILGPFDFVLHFYWTSFTHQYVSPLFLHFGSWSDSSLEHYMSHSSSTRKKVPTTKALAQMK